MSEPGVKLDRETGRRFVRVVRDFLTSDVRWRARGLFALLLAFALAVNGLNVVNSYVGRDFMTAIAHKDRAGFARQAVLYVGVFVASTAVAVLYRFTEERLGLFWRVWLTRRIVRRYLADRAYLRLKQPGGVDNPDQRIADDVRAFTATTLSFTLMTLNGVLAVLSFSGVLWAISPLLFGIAVGYAALGSLAAVALGLPLVGLNYRQSDREAGFRADLVHVRENAESVALLGREGRLTARLVRRIDALAENFRRITTVNRNLSFFTTGYNYLIQIIPTLIVAPLYIRGEVEFGVITQSAMAFAQLLGAFSLVVNQVQSLSSFAAVVARLSAMAEAVGRAPPAALEPAAAAATARDLRYEGLTLFAPEDGRVLLRGLTADVPRGTRLLVVGANETARAALFLATAGLWPSRDGTIRRPPRDAILFLPQRPYLPPGTFRELLLHTGQEEVIPDSRITEVLHAAGLDAVLNRAGGLDAERDWPAVLSLGEQQQLALARAVLSGATFVVLDRVEATIGPDLVRQWLARLGEHTIGCVHLAGRVDLTNHYDAILEIDAEGGWRWRTGDGGTAAGAARKELPVSDMPQRNDQTAERRGS